MSRYSEEEKQQILKLKREGFSSRKIAKQLDRSKSGINDFLASQALAKAMSSQVEAQCASEDIAIPNSLKKGVMPKVLFLDVEVAASISATFGRRLQNISHEAVIREGGWLLSYAAKWQGSDKIISSVVTPEEALDCNDLRLCAELHDLIEQADYMVAHNGDGFDKPVIKTRMIVNQLPPVRKVKSIDSLKMAREFRFNSNRLDALCKQLDLGRKIKNDGISLWVLSQAGDADALQKMLEYNIGDIPTLEALYNELRPYSSQHPNFAVHQGDVIRCNICCSDDIKETGNNIATPISIFPEYKCNSCGARFKGRKSKTTKEQRSNFLSN